MRYIIERPAPLNQADWQTGYDLFCRWRPLSECTSDDMRTGYRAARAHWTLRVAPKREWLDGEVPF